MLRNDLTSAIACLPSRALLLASGVALLAGCGGDDEALQRGEVLLSWEVGASTCRERGIVNVEAVLGPQGDTQRPSWSFLCEDMSGVIGGLEPGTYTFDLVGRDAGGTRRYRASVAAIVVRPGGRTVAPTPVLLPEPARLELSWNFGGPLCGPVDVATVEVLAFDRFDVLQQQTSAPCEAGLVTLSLQPGPYDIRARAVSAGGVLRDSFLLDLQLAPGEEAREEVVFTVSR